MNREDNDADDLLIDLGAASTQTLGGHQPNAPDGPAGFMINGGITAD